jgi:orotate phosphoribosyltransferase
MSAPIRNRARLLDILRKKSVFFGDFILSSGARSNFYFDCRLTTLDAEAAGLVGCEVWAIIEAEAAARGVAFGAVGGLTMGADPVALATGMASFQSSPERPLGVFVVRKTPKSHGQTKLIEGGFAEGQTVVVVDDVITTGDSTLKAIEAVRAAGGHVGLAVALLDREQGGAERVEAAGVPFRSVFKKRDVLPEGAPGAA